MASYILLYLSICTARLVTSTDPPTHAPTDQGENLNPCPRTTDYEYCPAFVFDDEPLGTCPSGWTCVGTAKVQTCDHYLGEQDCEHFLSVGYDGASANSVTSDYFPVPVDAADISWLRSGGAEEGGVRVEDVDGNVICEVRDGTDTNILFEQSRALDGYAGQCIRIYGWDAQNSGWGKVYVNTFQFRNATQSVLESNCDECAVTFGCSATGPIIFPTASSLNPTTSPSKDPTFAPTTRATRAPTGIPSTLDPTEDPTLNPWTYPTVDPTQDPILDPTNNPTVHPTTDPSIQSSIQPTIDPTAIPTTDPTVNPTEHPTEATVASDSIVISMDHISLIIALAAVFICLLLICCGTLVWIKCAAQQKLNGYPTQALQNAQQRSKNQIQMTNALIANITIGKYDEAESMTEAKSLFLEVKDVIEDMKQFAIDFGYKYTPITDKVYWTEQDILSFLRYDVGNEFFDENDTPKYDGLIVCIASYGNNDNVLTSDRQVFNKTAIHRIISNKYAAIREFPRIFIFDTCAVPEAIPMDSPAIDHSIGLTANSTETIQQRVVASASEEMDVGDLQSNEFQDDGSAPVLVFGKNTNFEDVRLPNEWTYNTKNPDYNLVNINAVGLDERLPNTIHYFTERVRENMDKKMELGLTHVEDKIKEDVRQHGNASFVPVLNNKTRTMMIRKREMKQ